MATLPWFGRVRIHAHLEPGRHEWRPDKIKDWRDYG